MKNLFEIKLDSVYLDTILLYGAFIIIVQMHILFFSKYKIKKSNKIILISHYKLFLLSIIFILASMLFFGSDIIFAIKSNISIYRYTRYAGNPYNQTALSFNRFSICTLYIGFSILLSGENAIYIRGKKNNKLVFLMYIILLIVISIYMFILGNRNELVTCSVVFMIFYFMNTKKPKYYLVIPIGLLSVLLISLIYLNRGSSLDNINYDMTFNYLIKSTFLSNEIYACHFSLYGVLDNDIALLYGRSIAYLFSSLIPSFMDYYRPEKTYIYYINSVNGSLLGGYSMHHITGWFLNFGYVGIFVGATFFSYIWLQLYNFDGNKNNKFIRIVKIVSLPIFIGSIPGMMRTSGPESYKPVLLYVFGIAIIFYLITKCRSVNLK